MDSIWLITGSSVGLGRSITQAALAAGHHVVATARDPRALDDLAAKFPDQILSQRLDVTDANRSREVVQATLDRFGRIDVLVHNAGFSGVGSIEDMPIDLIETQFQTNFMGAVHLCKAVLPTMRRQGRGRIILISSIGARIATAGRRLLRIKGRGLSARGVARARGWPLGRQGFSCGAWRDADTLCRSRILGRGAVRSGL